MGWQDDPVAAPAAVPGWKSDPTSAPAVAQDTPPSGAEALARGVGRGLTFDFGDEAGAAVGTVLQKVLPESMGGIDYGKDFGTLYRENRDALRRDNAAAEKAHGGLTVAGNVLGGIPLAIATGGGAAAGGAKTLLKSMAQGAKTGAKFGAVGGLGNSEADLTKGDVLGAVKDTSAGAALGAGIGSALPLAGRALAAGGRALVNGVVQPEPAAKALRQAGVKGLTLGQVAPESWAAQVEQAAQSVPFVGPLLEQQRQAGRQAWQAVVQGQVRPPGAPALVGRTVAERMDELGGQFKGAYDAIRHHPVLAVVPFPGGGRSAAAKAGLPLERALDRAVSDASVLADDGVRKTVGNFVRNALTETSASAGARPLNSGDLISLRSAIRSEVRSAIKGQNPDYKAARLLHNAEQEITRSLESQLPQDALAALQGTDRQYANYMRVVDAVGRSGDMPNGFTPAQLSQAVRSATEKTRYAAGGGGDLRALAANGRRVLDSTVPPTGARILAAPAAPLAALMATDVGKRALTGLTQPQLAAQAMAQALRARIPQTTAAGAKRLALISAVDAATQGESQ